MDSLSYPVILAISAVVLVLLGIVVGITSGSWIAFIVVIGLAGAILYIVSTFGTVNVTRQEKSLNIDVSPIPAPHDTETVPYHIKEVFHVSGNSYSFNDAPAVCAAYNSELASYDQIADAHSKGAEWCGYGWSAGGMALYPTQQATWESLQQNVDESKRTACGHPGVNGGYFDPSLKFGVNCYGKKPDNIHKIELPQPVPGVDQKAFESAVNKFKNMISSMSLSPFNRNLWSESTMPSVKSIPA